MTSTKNVDLAQAPIGWLLEQEASLGKEIRGFGRLHYKNREAYSRALRNGGLDALAGRYDALRNEGNRLKMLAACLDQVRDELEFRGMIPDELELVAA